MSVNNIMSFARKHKSKTVVSFHALRVVSFGVILSRKRRYPFDRYRWYPLERYEWYLLSDSTGNLWSASGGIL